jgi:hypothetical protein
MEGTKLNYRIILITRYSKLSMFKVKVKHDLPSWKARNMAEFKPADINTVPIIIFEKSNIEEELWP